MHVDLDTYIPLLSSIVLRWEMQSVWLRCTFYSEDRGRESIDIETRWNWHLLLLKTAALVYHELLVYAVCWRLLSCLSCTLGVCIATCAEDCCPCPSWTLGVCSVINSWCVQCAGECCPSWTLGVCSVLESVVHHELLVCAVCWRLCRRRERSPSPWLSTQWNCCEWRARV